MIQNSKEIKEILIKIFADYTIAEINNNPDLLKNAFDEGNRENILISSDFRKYYEAIKWCKKDIEKIKQYNKDEQLYRCLIYLKNLQASLPDINIADELIRLCIYPNWTEDDKTSYDEVFEMMTNWYDVFLSYLKREEFSRRINLSYHDLISASGYEQEYIKKRDNINFLAEMIAKRLEERLKVFYDRKVLSSGDKLDKTISDCCDTSFVLVQLVQREHFSLEEDDNWCYKEYCEFKDCSALKKWSIIDHFPRLHFLVECEEVEKIEELEEISKNPILYKEWCEDIKKCLHTKIKPYFQQSTDNTNILAYKNSLHRQIDDLSRKIINTKKEIITKILDMIIEENIEKRLVR